MGRLIDSFLLLAVLVVMLAGAAGIGLQSWQEHREGDRFQPAGERVAVDGGGRRIHLDCRGTAVIGRPTVLLEAPIMTPTAYWRPVQDLLVPFTRTCVYDRAGVGFSDLPDSDDIGRIVDDLQKALVVAGIGGPTLVVGAEEGAVHARSFAARHSDSVVAMVLVDPVTRGLLAAVDGRGWDRLRREVSAHRWAVELWAGRTTIGGWIDDRGLDAIDGDGLRWMLGRRSIWRAGVLEAAGLDRALVDVARHRGGAFVKPTLIVNSGRGALLAMTVAEAGKAAGSKEAAGGEGGAGSEGIAGDAVTMAYEASLDALARRYPKSTVLSDRLLAGGSAGGGPDGPLALAQPQVIVAAVNRVLGLVVAVPVPAVPVPVLPAPADR